MTLIQSQTRVCSSTNIIIMIDMPHPSPLKHDKRVQEYYTNKSVLRKCLSDRKI